MVIFMYWTISNSNVRGVTDIPPWVHWLFGRILQYLLWVRMVSAVRAAVSRLPQLLSHHHCWSAVFKYRIVWQSAGTVLLLLYFTPLITRVTAGRAAISATNLAVGNVSFVFDRCNISCVFVLRVFRFRLISFYLMPVTFLRLFVCCPPTAVDNT